MYKSLYESALNKDWENCEKWQLETNAIAKEYQKNKTLGESLAFLKFLMNKKGFCNKTMMPPLTEIK